MPRAAAARGLRLGLAGNASKAAYDRLELDVDFVASSADWGVEKPAPAFFERIVEACGAEPGRSRTSATASTTT